jgi:hypothetical protein
MELIREIVDVPLAAEWQCVMRTDPVADVPSLIDLRSMADAREWASTAMAKRPSRTEFFHRIADELSHTSSVQSSILELGSGPGFLARRGSGRTGPDVRPLCGPGGHGRHCAVHDAQRTRDGSSVWRLLEGRLAPAERRHGPVQRTPIWRCLRSLTRTGEVVRRPRGSVNEVRVTDNVGTGERAPAS